MSLGFKGRVDDWPVGLIGVVRFGLLGWTVASCMTAMGSFIIASSWMHAVQLLQTCLTESACTRVCLHPSWELRFFYRPD